MRSPARCAAEMGASRSLRVHRDGDRVLVFQAHGDAVADDVIEQQGFRTDGRTTGLWLSLPALLARTGWGREPGQERTLGVWLPVTALDDYLHLGVVEERCDDLFGGVRGQRMATRFAQVLVRWGDDVDLDGASTGEETPRLGLRQSALERFAASDVRSVEDWTTTVADGPAAVAARLPARELLHVTTDTLQRITGGR